MKSKFFFPLMMFIFSYVPTRAQNIDTRLLRDINPRYTTRAIKPCRVLSNLTLPISVAVPASFFTVGFIRNDKTLQDQSLTVAASLLIAEGLTIGIKYALKRPRPFIIDPEITKYGSGTGYSFQSGHTTAAFAIATSVSLLYPKWYVIAPSFAWASAVGFSRMYLGMHFPSDVLGGIVIGCGVAYVTYALRK